MGQIDNSNRSQGAGQEGGKADGLQDLHLVYVALGTNLGKREKNITEAVRFIETKISESPQDVNGKDHRLCCAPIYETAPAYNEDQPAFLNTAVKFYTRLAHEELHARLKQGEREIGRREVIRWGPRIIDMDIIFYDDLVFESEVFDIPKERMEERDFVLQPLCDLNCDVVHPLLKKTCQQLLAELNSQPLTLYLVQS
eukprot:Nk52_evm7s380 gene=Nk52_evmTU7s380